jgi:hypothetical protein
MPDNPLNLEHIRNAEDYGPPFALLTGENRIIAEVVMREAMFDIFKKLPDGQPIWVKAVEGLEEAKCQLTKMAAVSPGDYFIYNTRQGRVIAV